MLRQMFLLHSAIEATEPVDKESVITLRISGGNVSKGMLICLELS